jgi:hypothetical protein
LRGDEESVSDSIFGDGAFGFDDILMNTTLYRKYFTRQAIESRQREFIDQDGQEETVPPVKMEAGDTSLANIAENLSIKDSCSSSSTFTIRGTSAVVQQIPPTQEAAGRLEMNQLQDFVAGINITDSAGTNALIPPIVEAYIAQSLFDTEWNVSTPPVPTTESSRTEHFYDFTGNHHGIGELGDASSPIVKSSRKPTLINILLRRTLPPYSLYDFYLYMRDIHKGVDYIDFWYVTTIVHTFSPSPPAQTLTNYTGLILTSIFLSADILCGI